MFKRMSTSLFIKSIAIAFTVLIYNIYHIVHNHIVANKLLKSDCNFKIIGKATLTSGDPKKELEKGVLHSDLNSASY